MSRRTGTICSKHDNIMSLCDDIRKLANSIESTTEQAKDDGISMEGGLDEKRERIKELEADVHRLEKENRELTTDVERLTEELNEMKAML